MRVYWSDRLEELADRLFAEWEAAPVRDPFARTCVVVGDLSTRNWLQRHFLLHRKPGARRILANVDFKPLAEFVNDWLEAETHGIGGAHRRPAEHPYSKGVLAWRIGAVLKAEAGNPELAVLQAYIAHASSRVADRRRFELASRLAGLFGDYLESRYQMLADWEAGKMPSGDERWQAALYQLLVRETPDTYTRDYAQALAEDADPSAALRNGFPRYTAIHVFDVAAAPWPYLLMLKKMSDAIPTTFWTFNPSRAYWLDDPGRRKARREMARSLRETLQRGEAPPELAPDCMFDTPDSRLLGALAGGTRGVLSAELDLAEGDCEWVGDEDANAFASLARLTPEVHVCHSPRRELEAARDALHRFFGETPDARPSDALVLCADWGAYSPLVESVFGAGGDGGMPFALEGGMREDTPISHSLGALFEFGTNRFEVNAVFALLGVPAIRERFGIDADGLSVLREMVRANNIHWGYDDADVNDILGAAKAEEVYPFTWRRGLDRFIADALLGPRKDAEELVDAGRLGRLLPCGNVEAERARLVGALEAFVKALARLRAFLKAPHAIEEWRDRLLRAIDEFYQDGGSVSDELSGLRRAVVSATGEALIARTVGKPPCRNDPVPGDVMCAAILGAVNSSVRRVSSPGDAVRFAPLGNGTAVPARFVWICGLNDGTFPRTERRASFDLVGRRPTLFDVTPRDKDASALLKAALGARDRLSLSYVGRDVRSNEEVPAAVPLIDLIEWFKGTGREVKTYCHPLQAYSPRYFTEGSGLPPSYSAANYDAAVAILGRQGVEEMDGISVTPFSFAEKGGTVIDLDGLVHFYSRPNHFLACRRLYVRISKPGYDVLEDEDSLDANGLPKDLQKRLLVRGSDGVDVEKVAERLRETGLSLTGDELESVIAAAAEDGVGYRQRPLKYKKAESEGFSCPDKAAAEALAYWEDAAEPVTFHVDLEIEGRRVTVAGSRCEVKLNVVPSGQRGYVFEFSPYSAIYDSTKIAAWIRHVAGHAAGGDFVTAMMCMKDGPVRTYRPIPQAEAKALLEKIVVQAMKPMAFDYAAAAAGGGGDSLPDDFAAALEDYGSRIVSSYGKR